MKGFYSFLILLLCVVAACNKSETAPAPNNNNNSNNGNNNNNNGNGGNQTGDTFITYLIKTGNNYCEKNDYPLFKQSSLRFVAIFDSSCIYTNQNPENQADINKLYGFADSFTHHQTNSARFGWNWMDGKLHIHAYCYVSKTRIYEELGTVPLNTEVNCSIEVLPGKYVFTLNGIKDTLQRAAQDTVASGYKLFPYFGGDEPAPHDVKIRIKELK